MANLREWLEQARQVSPGPLIGGLMPSDRTLREFVEPEPNTVYGDILPLARPEDGTWRDIRPAVPGMLRDFTRAVRFPYDYAHSDMDPTSPEVVTRATETALSLMGGGAFMRAPANSLRSFAVRDADAPLRAPELPAAATPAEQQARAVLEMLRAGRAAEVTDEMMAAADPQYLFKNYDLPMDEASRMARAKEMGFDTGTPLYHGTTRDFSAFDLDHGGANTKARDAESAIYLTDGERIARRYAGEWGKEFSDDKELMTDAFPEVVSYNERLNAEIASARRVPDKDEREQLLKYLSGEYIRSVYDDGGNIVPVYLRGEMHEVPGGTYDEKRYTFLLGRAKQDGWAGVAFKGVNDIGEGVGPHDQLAVFDPANIRSRFARFDPRLSHLRNLNAANAAPEMALLPGAGEALRPELAAAQEDPMEAEIRRYLEAVMRGEAE